MLNCDEELENAVKEENYEKVRALLARGANPNHRFKRKMFIDESAEEDRYKLYLKRLARSLNRPDVTQDKDEIDSSRYAHALRAQDTLLHWTHSVEIARELLLYGADVNCLNKYRETPLHTAIVNCNKIELVRELLKHGADVNARSRNNSQTPLRYALKKQIKNLDVIKLLMKITVIRNFDRCMMYDDAWTKYPGYIWLYQLCIDEVLCLKKYNIINSLSLYEFLITKNLYITPDQAETKLNDQEILTRHPIYQDLILDKLKSCIKRSTLMDNLRKLEFYMKPETTSSNQDCEEKKIILNFDSTYNIVKYICNDDLENLIVAFYKGTVPLDFSDNGEFNQPEETLEDE